MPAKDQITIRMSAEDAGAFEMWRKQAKGPEAMGDAIEKAGKKGKQATNELTAELGNMIGKWASIGAAIETAKKIMEDYFSTKRELEQSEAQASAAADSALRKYFVTARIGDEKQQAASTQRIGNIALRQKTSLPAAGSAANMLTQFGVSRQEAEGGTLEELLQLQTAATATGGDPDEISRRVLEIIRRSTPGGKVNKGSIGKVGVAMRQLTSSDLGFSDDAFNLYAKHATVLQQGGYDTATAMALSAAISEKYDPRQARSIIKEIAKPGMQKGEAAFLARAKGALGKGGEADYRQAIETGRGSVASLQAESETGGTLAEMGQKKLTTDQIKKRLIAELRASGASESEITKGVYGFEHPGGFLPITSWYSDEQRAAIGLGGAIDPFNNFSPTFVHAPPGREQALQRVTGQRPLTVRIKGQDGRDVPHQVEAVGIQGR